MRMNSSSPVGLVDPKDTEMDAVVGLVHTVHSLVVPFAMSYPARWIAVSKCSRP
jgi:hypothetical protein